MHLLSFAEADVPADLRVQVLALQAQAWPGQDAPDPLPGSPPRLSHDPALAPRSFLAVEDGRVLAALDVLSKELVHARRRWAASGLSTVVTDPRERRRGHGRRLVTCAREAIAASGADLGLFTCDTPLGAFYEACGWSILPGTVLVGGTPADPLPSDRFDKVTLGAFFSSRARRHAADFVGARIGLYPGERDRLW